MFLTRKISYFDKKIFFWEINLYILQTFMQKLIQNFK